MPLFVGLNLKVIKPIKMLVGLNHRINIIL